MRVILIALAVVGLAFVALMLLAPVYVPSQTQTSSIRSDIIRNGPPGFASALGAVFSPFAPSVTPVASAGRCPAGNDWALPASEARYRVLQVRLAPEAVAGRLVFAPNDPREDGGGGPYVLCLRADGSNEALPADCESAEDIKPKGSLPVGPHGGCLAWQGLGTNPAPPHFE